MRQTRHLRIALFVAITPLLAPRANADATASETLYTSQVKPLLKARCYACHGALQQKGGLRLDTVALMRRGGDSGPVFAKGDADGSLLLERVASNDISERMPPEHEGELLTVEHLKQLRDWINTGADGPPIETPETDPRDHWAFRPVVRPSVPRLKQLPADNAIDAFLGKKLEDRGIRPQPEATRTELVRRVYLDLIGLPPSAEEIEAFLNDPAKGAYARLVDRLLEDPRHGERWARHWMDIWRYSDWWGLGDQLRNSQKHIWHWRDWIIESLNTDLSYDEMVRLMLAADELRPNDLSSLRATGFLARNYFLFNRNQWMDETVEHVSKGFLGLTINCVKCHDHKYDPIAQPEYYRMRAIFEPYHVRVDVLPGQSDLAQDGIPRAFDGHLDIPTYRFIRGEESKPDKSSVVQPGVPKLLAFASFHVEPVNLPDDASHPERRDWVVRAYEADAQRNVASAEAALAATKSKKEAPAALKLAELRLVAAKSEADSVQRRIAAQLASENKDAARAAAKAEREASVASARLRVAELEARLEKDEKAKQDRARKDLDAARAALDKAVAAAKTPGETFTKLRGAQWTPTRFFDSTKDDPEVTFPARSTGRRRALAQWITDRRNPLTARVAVNHLWGRHMGTPLVATVFEFGRKGSPPTNPELLDWLAAEFMDHGWSMKHLHRLIVTSEAYQRSSSTINADRSTASDPENTLYWRRTPTRLESQVVRDAILSLAGTLDPRVGGPPVLPANQADSRRRSLYFFHSNNDRNLFLTTFDEALVKECYRREQSIVPQQALAMTNSRLVLDSAAPIAERLERRLKLLPQGNSDEAFARLAYLVLLGSEPGAAEVTAMTRAVGEWKSLPKASGENHLASAPRANLVWVLLNHNDFVTLR